MKINYLKILIILSGAVLLMLSFLLQKRKIWFVYPDKNIKNVLFWQYHNSAIIEGINAKVDLNVFKGDILELNKLIMK